MQSIPEPLIRAYDEVSKAYSGLTPVQKAVAGTVGGIASVVVLGTAINKLAGDSGYQRKPSSFQLSGGSIDAANVKKEFDEYTEAYGATGTAEGIKDREKTVQLVDVFYSLVTDFYEWGWGASFHFSPKLPGKNWKASEAAHEARIPALLGVGPGKKILDCGCGVGGPLRTIASTSGAHVTGITINEYQVQRARHHNDKLGVTPLTSIVRGNFLDMPFEANTFDGAYAIEATCHAPKLEDVYGEVFRVIKPGCRFVTYEWVATPKYDPKNPTHVRIMDEINYGNGLPEMRTWKEAEEAGKKVGFQLVTSVDLATASSVAGPWYQRLAQVLNVVFINVTIVNTLHTFWLLPKGMKEVHDMLVFVAQSLVDGGSTGIFTPMHLLVFQKPK